MAENMYDFLCLYGLTKVGMISLVEERTMPQTINASVQEVIESQLKTCLILYSPDLNHTGEAKNVMKQNDSIVQLQRNEGSSFNDFWHELERSAFHSSHTVGTNMQYSINICQIMTSTMLLCTNKCFGFPV